MNTDRRFVPSLHDSGKQYRYDKKNLTKTNRLTLQHSRGFLRTNFLSIKRKNKTIFSIKLSTELYIELLLEWSPNYTHLCLPPLTMNLLGRNYVKKFKYPLCLSPHVSGEIASGKNTQVHTINDFCTLWFLLPSDGSDHRILKLAGVSERTYCC